MIDRAGTIACVLGTALLAGCASAPPTPTDAAEPAKAVAENQPAEPKLPDNCIRETGSRIKRAPGECIGLPGTVITREELERSGSIRTLDQLRRLPGM